MGKILQSILFFYDTQTNPVLNWPMNSAESMFFSSAELIKPIFDLIEEPVTKIDNFLCKTLDFVELKIPSVFMPPEMVRKFQSK